MAFQQKNQESENITKNLSSHVYKHPYLNASIENAINIWHKSSYNIAKNFVYQQKQNKKISYTYKNKSKLIVKGQLLKAGIHLSQLLNSLYK